jgi:hypothetical protein
MTTTFADEPTLDVTPDFVDDSNKVEYPCQECGKEAGPYRGRGRKPTRCDEHKKSSSNSTTRTPRVTGKSADLAIRATEALCSIDGVMALGATVVGFYKTAETIQEADEVFRIRVHAALLNSPDTCQKILRYGSKGGDLGLIIAIGLHIATIAPVFAAEAKEKKAEKEAQRLADELNASGS